MISLAAVSLISTAANFAELAGGLEAGTVLKGTAKGLKTLGKGAAHLKLPKDTWKGDTYFEGDNPQAHIDWLNNAFAQGGVVTQDDDFATQLLRHLTPPDFGTQLLEHLNNAN